MNIERYQTIKLKILSSARLLERRLYGHFFILPDLNGCLKALAAYQNADGGFGHGLEPDLLTPSSTGIAAETALMVLDMLDARPVEILQLLAAWVESSLTERGIIAHPPDDIEDYSHQPWWKNADDHRIMAVAGWMKKFGFGSERLFDKARAYYQTTDAPEPDNF